MSDGKAIPADFGCCKGDLIGAYHWHQFTCPNWETHYYRDLARRKAVKA
jgi:hypothetical protein